MYAYISFLTIAISILCACGYRQDDGRQDKTVNENISGSSANYKLEPVVSGLHAPVYFTHAGDKRWFIVEQGGRIRIVKEGKLLPEPFLDIRSKVESGKNYSEKGLLGLAFHPDYKNNGRFFVYYSAPYKQKGFDHKSILSEFKVSENPDRALAEEKILLEIPEPESNHNGGQIVFGPDNYLYLGPGDGGGAGDKHGTTGNGQNIKTLLGKILRIDVDGQKPYSIPKDNPFAGNASALPEIWAYGLRNPWRFSFDRKTKELYCGDVGQNSYEEIDIITKGGNYGWRAREGKHEYDKNIPAGKFIDPIWEYPRNAGICVIGGYVYRGKKYPKMEGKYIFGDWTGKVYSLDKTSGHWEATKILEGDFMINSFGEDVDGELYLLAQEEQGVESQVGTLYKLVLNP